MSEQNKESLADVISSRFAGSAQPATVEMVADCYAKIALVAEALIAMARYSTAPAVEKTTALDEMVNSVLRLSRDLSDSVAGLSKTEAEMRGDE